MTIDDPRWRWVGRLCLDLAMTGGRGEWARFERLHAPRDLRDWFAEGSLGLRGVQVDERGLECAADLRQAIQEVAFALLDARRLPDGAVAALNAAAAAPPLARVLDPETLSLSVSEPAALPALLSEIARDALALAADPRARGRVRRCESPDCGLVFFDDSRPGRRRWCSPGRCGDRARARAYRARRKAAR